METITQNNLEEIRIAIRREFIDRCRKNPAYSLRAFAKYLDINQSFLSKLLKGQRAITKDFAISVGPKLGLKPSQVKALFASGSSLLPGFISLSDDEFDLLSSWHHFAIIELSKTNNFDANELKISQRIGVHVAEVRDALERLQRLNFIQIKKGKLKLLTPNTTWSNSKKTSEARKQFQKTLLEKSLEAIDTIPFDLRENGSVTVAINKKRMPEFKEKIKEMRIELANFFQKEGEKDLDEVYQLTISFFPLTKVLNTNKGE